MRFGFGSFAFTLLCGTVSSAMAGINVSSYTTVAETNAYAPLSRAMYFATDDKPNTSPAVADVSADWTGTNIGGTETTWHMVSAAHVSSTSTITADTLTVTGEGSFSYDLLTTAGFVEPTRVTTGYVPGAGAGQRYFFTVDTAAQYTLEGRLNRSSAFYLASFDSGVIVDQFNGGVLPKTVDLNGTLPPGRYEFSATSNRHGPSGLPSGVNHIVASGSFNELSFSVQVPEPQSIIIIPWAVILTRRFRRR